jgi:hypothetical protein
MSRNRRKPGMTRAEAIEALVEYFIRTSSSLDELISLLGAAGMQPLATTLREHRPVRIGNGPGKLDAEMWRTGQLK